MSTQTDLLQEIEAYLACRPIAESTFGRLAVNDGKFVGRLRAGANMTIGTVSRVRLFIEQNPPLASAPSEAA